MGYGRPVETQRVWLDRGEWNCCGEPFEVGDQVTFRTAPRNEELTTLLGPELSRSVDRHESHHDDDRGEPVSGTVVALWAVVLDYIDRRMPRGPDTPSRPVASPESQSGAGWIAMGGAGRPYVTVRELVPGSARLSTVPRVPWPPRESEPTFDGQPTPDGLAGYLVDIGVR
ncbi:DUF6578 domain-containing protein [Agromyces ramosus]|uniref:DUF6578 domain-containing protein n=1 Tax=Agromyces ramosus TaxID=33879 RepID=UPI0035943F4A